MEHLNKYGSYQHLETLTVNYNEVEATIFQYRKAWILSYFSLRVNNQVK